MTRHDEPAEGDVAGVAEVNRVARLLMAEWERVEGKPVNISYVATFADMARAVIADHRDLIAAAEQRGRVAALREAGEAVKAESVNAHDYRRNRGTTEARTSGA